MRTMSKQAIIEKEILQHPEKELIYASKLYQAKFATVMSEHAYYKAVERLNASKFVTKMAKGIYCRPKTTKYGIVLPSEREIVKLFTEKNKGTVVGYSMYNSLNLTTQIAKKHEVYSSSVGQLTKTIGNVLIKQYMLDYSDKVTSTIHMMEVLQHYNEIQNLNMLQFINLCEKFKNQYSEEVFEYVIKHIRYSKRTISFLKNILDYYHMANSLGRYLSVFSEYNHPRMETIYEPAQIY
jgi:hypothetical protein